MSSTTEIREVVTLTVEDDNGASCFAGETEADAIAKLREHYSIDEEASDDELYEHLTETIRYCVYTDHHQVEFTIKSA